MGHMCDRWSGEPCEEEGHARVEAGETRKRERGEELSRESRQHELAQQGAVGGSEEQDRHCTHTVQDSHYISKLTDINMMYTLTTKLDVASQCYPSAIISVIQFD